MNVLAGECGEISHAMSCCEIVGHGSVEHGNCCLGELKIKTNAQWCGSTHGHGNKACEVNGAGDMDKAYVLLMAEIDRSDLHWEEQGWIAGDGGIGHARTSQVMEQDDGTRRPRYLDFERKIN